MLHQIRDVWFPNNHDKQYSCINITCIVGSKVEINIYINYQIEIFAT